MAGGTRMCSAATSQQSSDECDRSYSAPPGSRCVGFRCNRGEPWNQGEVSMFEAKPKNSTDFSDRDNDRWRAAFSPQEQSVFDTLVHVAFGESSSFRWSPSRDISELWRVQE